MEMCIYCILIIIHKQKLLKLIILENASVVRSYDGNPTQNFFINYIFSCGR
jgi:hypothetical protein